MKFVNENQATSKVHLNFPKVTPFQRHLCKIFREKQYIGIVYSYITQLSLSICYEIKSLLYTFDSLVNIRLIKKEACEYRCFEKNEFLFDFQSIYSTKLQCRPSLKSLQTFLIIRDGMTLSQSNTINSCHCPCLSQIPSILITALGIHYFSSSCQKQTKKQTYMNDFIQ